MCACERHAPPSAPPTLPTPPLAARPPPRRIRRVGAHTLLAASGEYSDFQYIMDLLQELVLSEHVRDDDAKITASEVRARPGRRREQWLWWPAVCGCVGAAPPATPRCAVLRRLPLSSRADPVVPVARNVQQAE